MNSWKSEELTNTYLEGVRGAIPLAQTQIDIIKRITKAWLKDVQSFLDLGCGDGILGKCVYDIWPESNGVFLDFSEPMLKQAKANSSINSNNSMFVLKDYSEENWTESIETCIPFDLVISGFSIHHLEDDAKIKVYKDVFKILKPGGLFLNLEHVSSRSSKIEKVFDELFVDHMVSYHEHNNPGKSKEQIETEYYHREDKELNKLISVENQCEWLREIGFKDVDCYFKILELALFGGIRPKY